MFLHFTLVTVEKNIFKSISTIVHDQAAKYMKSLCLIVVHIQTNFQLKIFVFFYFNCTNPNNLISEMLHFAHSRLVSF